MKAHHYLIIGIIIAGLIYWAQKTGKINIPQLTQLGVG